MVQTISNIVSWLKNWFYEKSEVYSKSESYSKTEVDTALSNKLNANLTVANKNLETDGRGNVILVDKPVIDNSLSSTSTNAVQNKVIQSAITTINNRLDTVEGIKFIEIVNTKPTASADTMNKLYIVSENNKVNVYYTKQNGSTYTLEKLEDDILDELSISWTDVQNKPSTFPPSTHTHEGEQINVSYTSSYGYAVYGNLQDYVSDVDRRITSIDVPTKADEILTHIDTYYDNYQ